MNYPIFDLHCDLLMYLQQQPMRTAFDAAVRCSIPQLRRGNVCLQTMAISVATGYSSSISGLEQGQIFKDLPKKYPMHFKISNHPISIPLNAIQILLAIENASCFAEEEEPLEAAFKRLDFIIKTFAKPLYVSLTWNGENRFGGGSHTNIGLKEDGKELVRYLDGKKIAIDLSHASDQLAYDILNFIQKNPCNIPIIASHSNARAVTQVARNLPDDLIREICHLGGIIGINFIRYFIHVEDSSFLQKHVEHFLNLGAENHLCFGGDFFYEKDIPEPHRKPKELLFYDEYQDASCYPIILNSLPYSQAVLEKISYQNFMKFFFVLIKETTQNIEFSSAYR